jgi:hypothetical protein
MLHLDNPAGRLHWFLAAMRTQPQHLTIDQATAEVPGGGPSRSKVMHAMADVMAMPAEIRAQVEEFSDADGTELLLRWEPRVRDALGACLILAQPLNNLLSQYNDTDLLSLEHCSWELHRRCAQQVVGEAELARLRAELDAVRDDILAADLPAGLRGFLLEHLDEMSRALWAYQLRGITAIEEAYDRAAGALRRRADFWAQARQENREDPDGPVGRFSRFMGQILTVITVTGLAFALPGQAVNMIDAIEGKKADPTILEIHQDPQPPLPVTSGQP